jgi:hypothetical protein
VLGSSRLSSRRLLQKNVRLRSVALLALVLARHRGVVHRFSDVQKGKVAAATYQ